MFQSWKFAIDSVAVEMNVTVEFCFEVMLIKVETDVGVFDKL